jgi:hypothetical protein
VLDGHLVRPGVRPRANGAFAAKFVARVGPGTYVLVAKQDGASQRPACT